MRVGFGALFEVMTKRFATLDVAVPNRDSARACQRQFNRFSKRLRSLPADTRRRLASTRPFYLPSPIPICFPGDAL